MAVAQKKRSISLITAVPWSVSLIIYMVIVHFTGLNMDGPVGYGFVALGVAVLFVEFFKSGDISAAAFLIDIFGAVLSVIVATALMTYIYLATNKPPTFFHWFGCAVILGDAVLSPFNAFRTALRNLGLGVSTGL
jgi:hypothetical protein